MGNNVGGKGDPPILGARRPSPGVGQQQIRTLTGRLFRIKRRVLQGEGPRHKEHEGIPPKLRLFSNLISLYSEGERPRWNGLRRGNIELESAIHR
eukprot:2750712-Pyramimonas_sp.AAC.1